MLIGGVPMQKIEERRRAAARAGFRRVGARVER
jgi:hypothetical protein